jgi:hypothetical protein
VPHGVPTPRLTGVRLTGAAPTLLRSRCAELVCGGGCLAVGVASRPGRGSGARAGCAITVGAHWVGDIALASVHGHAGLCRSASRRVRRAPGRRPS